jgi:hypothetical protein
MGLRFWNNELRDLSLSTLPPDVRTDESGEGERSIPVHCDTGRYQAAKPAPMRSTKLSQ